MKTFLKDYSPVDIRNCAIVGHASSGKTMLTEALLRASGATTRLGHVNSGNTASDYHEDERQRHISIHASLMHTEFGGKKINFIDTPGYSDFINEGLGALRVADEAIVVVDAERGVEPGTHRVWNWASETAVPKIIVMNGMDKDLADAESQLAMLREVFGERVFPLTLPVDAGPGFHVLLDILHSQVAEYDQNERGVYHAMEPLASERLALTRLHNELLELVAESDDQLLQKYFEAGTLSDEEVLDSIHDAIQRQVFIPLFCTSAETNVGVAHVLEFISRHGITPMDHRTIHAEDENGGHDIDLAEPEPVLFVFKTEAESHAGDMAFVKVLSGRLHTGMDLLNADTHTQERIGHIYLINGRHRIPVDHLNPGDLGALVKLKNTHTGDTLCSPQHELHLPRMIYPAPNIHVALSPTRHGDEEKIAAGLASLHEEDPSFVYRVDPESRQTVLSGQGELHLRVISERLQDKYRVAVELEESRIPYRETIQEPGESRHRHKKQSGGAGQFAEVWLRVEPLPRDSGVMFTESLVGQNVSRSFVPAVEKGVREACAEGVLAGCPVSDVLIDFYDGKEHPVDSKEAAFYTAGKQAFQAAFHNASPCLLEPVLELRIHAPDAFLGGVMGDLNSRRSRILGVNLEDGLQVIEAHVPQKELYRYSSQLRALTEGRGWHTEMFRGYERLPDEIEPRVIEALQM